MQDSLDLIEKKKLELKMLVQHYWESTEALKLSPDGGTESGISLEEILGKIEALCEEIKPGSTDSQGEVFQDEEDRITTLANKVLS